eukprot:2840334-Pleurochrysis_carterae.AAC.1
MLLPPSRARALRTELLERSQSRSWHAIACSRSHATARSPRHALAPPIRPRRFAFLHARAACRPRCRRRLPQLGQRRRSAMACMRAYKTMLNARQVRVHSRRRVKLRAHERARADPRASSGSEDTVPETSFEHGGCKAVDT